MTRHARAALLGAALLAQAPAAGCGGGSASAVPFSIVLGDGRTCHDAGVTAVLVERGEAAPQRFLCYDAEAPRSQTAADLPLTDALAVRGVSPEGGQLYLGRLIAADALAAEQPVTIVLYPDWAR